MLYIWHAMDVVADGSHNGRSLFNVLKRFPVPQNMGVEYPHAIVIKIRKFRFFAGKSTKMVTSDHKWSHDGRSVKIMS